MQVSVLVHWDRSFPILAVMLLPSIVDDLLAQLARLGGADGGVRQRERRVRLQHAQLPVVLHQLLVAKVLRHEGVGGQRLGYLVHL